MTKHVTLADLEASFLTAQANFYTSDLNYMEWVKETPPDELIAETEHSLDYHDDILAFMKDEGVWEVYVAAKVFTLYRDQGRIAAISWTLVNGGAA